MSGIAPITPLVPLQSVFQGENTAGIDATQQIGLPSGGTNSVSGSSDFAGFLNDALQKVDALQKDSDQASADLVSGNIDDMHTAVIAMEKANLALSLTVEVRNKILDAYQEMMRMQI